MAATYPATHTVETVEITLFLLGFLNRASEVRILSGVPISNRLKTLIFQRFQRFLFCLQFASNVNLYHVLVRFGAIWYDITYDTFWRVNDFSCLKYSRIVRMSVYICG